jgi:hypothetical protein
MKILKHNTLRCAVRATLLTCGLSVLLLIGTANLATAQGKNTTTTSPSNEYGEGGTEETISDENFRVTRRTYRDKCGRVRQIDGPIAMKEYYSPAGDAKIFVTPWLHSKEGGSYEYSNIPHREGQPSKLHPENGKEIIEGWQKAPIPPCPEKTNVAPAPPEKPKDHPNPLEKVLQHVSVGIGVNGGTTVGHDEHKGDHHVTDHKRTSSTTKKLPAGCKCHPCTCSPCHCGG